MKKFLVPIFLFLFPFLVSADVDTYFLNSQNGGDCSLIGAWNAGNSTCILSGDVFGSIIFEDDNIVLDGVGHTVSGDYSLTSPAFGPVDSEAGLDIFNKKNITIKNLSVLNFEFGIRLSLVDNVLIENVSLTENQTGISVVLSENSVLKNNTIYNNKGAGLNFLISPSNNFTLKDNEFFDNNSSLNIRNSLIFGGVGHNIDSSNKIDGRPIYYFENLKNERLDDLGNIGLFVCVSCQRVFVSGADISSSNNSVFYILNTADSHFENIFISSDKNGTGVSLEDSDNNVFARSDFYNNIVGIKIDKESSGNRLFQNNFYNNSISDVWNEAGNDNQFSAPLPVGGNWWQRYDEPSEGCDDEGGDEICDSSFELKGVPSEVGGFDDFPRVSKNAWPSDDCCSNVLFLPGLKGSRLYSEDGLIGDNRLWEPNISFDIDKLLLNEDGSSVDPDIFTKDVIDEIYGQFGNIYKSFLADLNQMVADEIINEAQAFPYDWRIDLEEIVLGQTKLPNGETVNLIDTLESLAENSKTGQVAIVAHSNGGLVSKVLIEELKKQGKEYLVERLVMVGTPQIGTALSVPGLLHGEGQDMSIVVNKEKARIFGENMMGGYNLLPSEEYADNILQSLVSFDLESESTQDFIETYGHQIESREELDNFMLGLDGREKPETDDVLTPTILNENLLLKSKQTQEFLDNWVSPTGLAISKVVGWGLETIRATKYEDKEKPSNLCSVTVSFVDCDKIATLNYRPVFTIEGDGTVVYISASFGEGEAFYVDLEQRNHDGRINRTHKNLLEVDSIRILLSDLIQNSLEELPEYISKEKPSNNDLGRLLFSVHSPVSIGVKNESGLSTGIELRSDPSVFSEEIPNSFYMEFGEGKYVGVRKDKSYKIELRGLGYGTFDLEISELYEDNETLVNIFESVVVTPNSLGYLSVSETGEVGVLQMDIDGDGVIDFEYIQNDRNIESNVSAIGEVISGMDIQIGIKNALIQRLLALYRISNEKVFNQQLDNVKEFIIKQTETGHIKETDAQILLEMILFV